MKDGHYMQPLEAKRPKEIVKVDRFFKYNNKILYPVETSSWWNRSDAISPYYFIYDCIQKRPSDKTPSFATMNRLWVSPMQSSWSLLLVKHNRYEWGDPTNYSIININKLSFETINIKNFKWFVKRKDAVKKKLKELFNTTKDPFIGTGTPTKAKWWNADSYRSNLEERFPQNTYEWSRDLSSFDKSFNWKISFMAITSREDAAYTTVIHYLAKSKINLLTKTITVE